MIKKKASRHIHSKKITLGKFKKSKKNKNAGHTNRKSGADEVEVRAI